MVCLKDFKKNLFIDHNVLAFAKTRHELLKNLFGEAPRCTVKEFYNNYNTYFGNIKENWFQVHACCRRRDPEKTCC